MTGYYSRMKLINNFKSPYGFGGRNLKIRDVCMNFEPYFKVHNVVFVHPKSIILGQMIDLSTIFYVVVSAYRLLIASLLSMANFVHSPKVLRSKPPAKYMINILSTVPRSTVPHLSRILKMSPFFF